MKKKLLSLLLALPFVAVMNVNAQRVNQENIHYDYDFGNIEIKHTYEGYCENYLDIIGLTKSNLQELNTSYTLVWTKKGEDLPLKLNGSNQYYFDATVSTTNDNDATEHHAFSVNATTNSTTGKEHVGADADGGARWFYDEDYNNFYLVKRVYRTENNNTYNFDLYISRAMSATRYNFKSGEKFEFLIAGNGYKTLQGEQITSSSMFSNMPFRNSGLTRKIQIVKITDNSIIRNYANSESGYNALIDYVKHNSGLEASMAYNETSFNSAGWQFEPNTYYGLYIDYEPKSGSIDQSDAVIAFSGQEGNHLVYFNDFSQFREGETTANTTTTKPKNPKTGVEDLIYVVPVILIGGLGAITLAKRKTSFR